MTPSNSMCEVPNYGSSASYCDLPSPEQIRAGVVPLDSLPAAWWNAMWACTNGEVNKARDMLGQLITELNSVLTQAGVCACSSCTDQLYQSIDKIRQTLANATIAGAVKSSSQPSEVAVNEQGYMTVNCLGNAASLTTSASTVVGAINELKSTYDTCWSNNTTALSGKAPTSHASTATTYGVGNADNYGHLKISDTYTSVLATCSGVAASQKAVACVYAAAAAAAAGNVALGNTAGCALGTAAAGTATTSARSDHVHPTTGLATVKCENGYYGLGYAGTYTGYLRTPASGLIPYASTANGCGYLGTSSWPFLAAYAKTFYGALSGNASTATLASYAVTGGYLGERAALGCAPNCSYGIANIWNYCNDSRYYLIGTKYDDTACKYNVRVDYATSAGSAVCASCNGSGVAFGTAATCAASAFRSCTWTPSCVACAGTIKRTGYTTAYDFDVALTNNSTTADGTTFYVSNSCRLKYCNTTGVLKGVAFCGALYGCACCAGRNGSGTAFGSAATCAATAFRSCTWWPDCVQLSALRGSVPIDLRIGAMCTCCLSYATCCDITLSGLVPAMCINNRWVDYYRGIMLHFCNCSSGFMRHPILCLQLPFCGCYCHIGWCVPAGQINPWYSCNSLFAVGSGGFVVHSPQDPNPSTICMGSLNSSASFCINIWYSDGPGSCPACSREILPILGIL